MESIKLGDGPCRLLGPNSGCINVVRAGTRFVLELRELFDLAVQSDGAASEKAYIKKASCKHLTSDSFLSGLVLLLDLALISIWSNYNLKVC